MLGVWTWTSAKRPVSVGKKRTPGDVTVTAPEQTGPDGNPLDYAVDALSEAGRVEVDVVQDPRSRRSITAVGHAGDVRIGYR